jgi:steroid delta-isomerase-like uncharacterized protein
MVLIASITGTSRAAIDVEQNKSIIRSWFEKLNGGDWKGALELFADDARSLGRPVGRRGLQSVLEDIFRMFPDLHMEIRDMVAEGDSVVVTCKVSGTHRGKGTLPIYAGLLVGLEPTQKQFEILHIHWFKLRDGKIVDHWDTRDDIRMMQQLGSLPRAKNVKMKP